MPSTATARNRLEQQAPGENGNTWGDKLNTGVIALVDQALDGMTSFALSGPKTLTSTNFAADEARARYLNVTGGTGGTVTIPNVEKLYLVRNGSSGNVVLTTGAAGATDATVAPGTVTWVVCEGGNIIRALTVTNNFGTAGVIINGQTLDGLTAAGVAMAEAADAATQRNLLGLGDIATRNKATLAEFYAGSVDKALTVDAIGGAFGGSDAISATSWDAVGSGKRVKLLTLSGDATLAVPTGMRVGDSVLIEVAGNDATSRSLAFGSGLGTNVGTIAGITSTTKYVVTIARLVSGYTTSHKRFA